MKRKLLAIITVVAVMMSMTIPVYANGGYIVRTTEETITMVGDKVVGYTTNTYDSPVYYGTAPAASYCSSWKPDWGANYAAEQAKYMESAKRLAAKSSSSSCWKPQQAVPVQQTQPQIVAQPITPTYIYNYGYTYSTVGDEAKSRASSMEKYAKDYGWNVSVGSDYGGGCDLRFLDITFSNKRYSNFRVTQVTEWNGSGYNTYYKYNDRYYSADGLKDSLKGYRD